MWRARSEKCTKQSRIGSTTSRTRFGFGDAVRGYTHAAADFEDCQEVTIDLHEGTERL